MAKPHTCGRLCGFASYATSTPVLEVEEIRRKLLLELQADRAFEDETSRTIVPADLKARAKIVGRQPGVFCGGSILQAISSIDSELSVGGEKSDGQSVESGDVLAHLEGGAVEMLAYERTLLNFLALSCGVATLTAQYVSRVRGFETKILATRKTLPGLRDLQLQAVVAGGGHIHRRSLSDGVLIKDNHLAVLSPADAVRKARTTCSPLHQVEIELDELSELDAVLEAKPDVIMLDNLPPAEIIKALKIISGKAKVEVSGGVTLETVRGLAELGVDYISVGRLTHSVPAFDLSLELENS